MVKWKKIVTCIKIPYFIIIDRDLLNNTNILEVCVSNLMTNRVLYMDKEKVDWRKFYDINFPAKNSENTGSDDLFYIGEWDPFKSGLIDPVKLISL